MSATTILSIATINSCSAMAAMPVDVSSLSRRGRALGTSWWGADSPQLKKGFTFPSSYTKEGEVRGWCNWLVEERLMLGQYPHCQPAVPGPSREDAKAHLEAVLDAGIDCFVSLQAELPPQQDEAAWPEEGVRLGNDEDRARWPEPFVRYAADIDAIAATTTSSSTTTTIQYLHCLIVDLSIPQMPRLLTLLDELLAHYESGGRAAYIHCWGGRGRAGLVGACMLSLLRPDLDANAVLDAVQTGYDSRRGAETMPSTLKRSPQTEPQRKFVRSFVSSVRASRRYDNDLDMQSGGMPKGYL